MSDDTKKKSRRRKKAAEIEVEVKAAPLDAAVQSYVGALEISADAMKVMLDANAEGIDAARAAFFDACKQHQVTPLIAALAALELGHRFTLKARLPLGQIGMLDGIARGMAADFMTEELAQQMQARLQAMLESKGAILQ